MFDHNLAVYQHECTGHAKAITGQLADSASSQHSMKTTHDDLCGKQLLESTSGQPKCSIEQAIRIAEAVHVMKTMFLRHQRSIHGRPHVDNCQVCS